VKPVRTRTVVPLGMIHGRFQPFHKQHYEYLLSALPRCELLVVGITNPDTESLLADEESPHRHLGHANPYSYFDRMLNRPGFTGDSIA
jgi:hypothetical protein